MFSARAREAMTVVMMVGAMAACGSSPGTSPPVDTEPQAGGHTGSGGKTGTGGSSASGGSTGSSASGGSSGSGGQSATGGSGAGGQVGTGGSPSTSIDAGSSGGTGGGGVAPTDAAPAADLGASPPFNIMDFGGVGATPFVPMQYTAAPVPPIVAAECPEDPTAGFTEYKGFFKVQRPSNLSAGDRFSYENGIYNFWVQSNDQSHSPGNGTAPRTEARYTDFSSGAHIWSADMMYEHVDKTCIMQIHNEVGNYATYLRITGDMMFDLKTRKTVTTGLVNKWFNMKVMFDTQSLDVKIYINNCLKFTAKSPQGPTPNWYFKHGVYTCESGTCKSHYKNIHLYQKGVVGPPTMVPTMPGMD
jgi:hypothetical protein